jgi:hypothetical protein
MQNWLSLVGQTQAPKFMQTKGIKVHLVYKLAKGSNNNVFAFCQMLRCSVAFFSLQFALPSKQNFNKLHILAQIITWRRKKRIMSFLTWWRTQCRRFEAFRQGKGKLERTLQGAKG